MIPYSILGHIRGIGSALTQLLNAVKGSCDPNQTYSERCYLKREHWYFRWQYKALNWVAFREDDHCLKARVKETRAAVRRAREAGYTCTLPGDTTAAEEQERIMAAPVKKFTAKDFDKWWNALSEQEVKDIREYGADFPGWKMTMPELREWKAKAKARADSYMAERYPPRKVTGHGMDKAGGQK